MEYHLTSLAMNSLWKIVEQKYLLHVENHGVVTLPLCDDVTMKHFVGKIFYFKA